MDDATEPLIAVIGHPIAGHPAQFALEMAFDHLGLEFRVASFSVPPDQLGKALDGLEVLRFRGVYLDDSLRQTATNWLAHRNTTGESGNPDLDGDAATEASSHTGSSKTDGTIANTTLDKSCFQWLSESWDCLSRCGEPDAMLVPSAQERTHVIRHVQDYFDQRNQPTPSVLVLKKQSSRASVSPSHSELESADLIVIPNFDTGDTVGQDAPNRSRSSRNLRANHDRLSFDDWPDGERLVVDLRPSNDSVVDEAAHQALMDRGYTVLTAREILVGGLAGCIAGWTGREIAHEILADAIEEYTAV